MRRPVRDALGLGILGFLTLGIGALDCATGRNVSLWFVYVLPICMAAAIGGCVRASHFRCLPRGFWSPWV